MSSQHSIDFLDKIQLEFGKNYSDAQYAEFNDRLSGYSRAVLDAAHKEITLHCERLPPFAAIHKAISAAIASLSTLSATKIDPCSARRAEVEAMLTRWSNEFQNCHLYAKATREGTYWHVYKYARSMAETQAWMIVGGNAPGYCDFDWCAVRNKEEYEHRKWWYNDLCTAQAKVGRIEVSIPDYVFSHYKSLLKS